MLSRHAFAALLMASWKIGDPNLRPIYKIGGSKSGAKMWQSATRPFLWKKQLFHPATFAGLWRVLLPHRLESDFWPSNGLEIIHQFMHTS